MAGIPKVKVAVVGCGVISETYLTNMTKFFEILDVVGCCDIIKERVEKRANQFNIRQMTIDEILNDKSIELVLNITDPVNHHLVSSQVLNAGKNLYSEKPIDLSIEAARELVQLADKKGLLYGNAPDTFMGEAIQTARFYLDSGLIGDITSVTAVLNRDAGLLAELYPFTAGPGGGIGLDVGVYYVTAMLSILGPVKQVSGFVQTRNPERTHYLPNKENFGEKFCLQAENLVAGSFEFASGVYGSLMFNSCSIGNEKPQIVMYGTDGILYMPDPNRFGGEVKVILKGQTEPVTLQPTHTFSESHRGIGPAELAWSLRKGRKPRTSKEMAFHGLELLLGLYKSCETKQFYQMTSTFQRPNPIPRGYLGSSYGGNAESGLAV
ncbi:Gfo/Idh/MocA family protein [Leadbettera azotonutricia]|uniref:Oxidoreductase domain protein n=1 Tax=Leadbettera azotonutricia (strain ATCC BAA-888 / DSM 13862 / ZAS-9) TaxID=545695 RepID=F5YAD2_LEAAZ|nr:Gfo/Idh/MocA family oxidoreductase [Leadbettera azotonutricia]AEF83095.1 oxidoreductase domain protein [Leadbettera azotonutricia ZAS-9]